MEVWDHPCGVRSDDEVLMGKSGEVDECVVDSRSPG
jgi:hypothetical protein